MFSKTIASRMLSLGLLSTVLLAGAFATPASADSRDHRFASRSMSFRSYSDGFRDGYRAGYRDGRADGIRSSRSDRARSFRRRDSRTPYDRGFEIAYERGYRSGINSVRWSRRHHNDRDDWRDGRSRHDHDDE
jgi:hypothetical protein